ncbi:hypothetical protein [Marinospirillum sp.]|uniref:hypothetical protein n=1 Tax=Marinospirillum sp. TaxID=2183934 RepID=UPI00384AB77A
MIVEERDECIDYLSKDYKNKIWIVRFLIGVVMFFFWLAVMVGFVAATVFIVINLFGIDGWLNYVIGFGAVVVGLILWGSISSFLALWEWKRFSKKVNKNYSIDFEAFPLQDGQKGLRAYIGIDRKNNKILLGKTIGMAHTRRISVYDISSLKSISRHHITSTSTESGVGGVMQDKIITNSNTTNHGFVMEVNMDDFDRPQYDYYFPSDKGNAYNKISVACNLS